MKKLAVLESGFLISLVLLTFAFIGAPRNSQNAPISTPPPQSLKQGVEEWDKNLVLPTSSERIANYTMDVKLDTAKNLISGWEIVEWKNNSGKPQTEFPFHLYHNAWRNNRSTFAKEAGWQLSRPNMRDEDYGYTNVKSIKVIDPKRGEIDITKTLEFIQPDDGNADDRTVFRVSIPPSISSFPSVKFRIEFETKQPLPLARTGAIRNYHFVAQWFPKIGVWWKPRGSEGAWNCHQFHATTEFFADYGVYDVKITVPKNYIVGATGGVPRNTVENTDGTHTLNFRQEDVHDFAWVTSPDLVVNVRKFSHTNADADERSDRHHVLKEVTVILLTQPHHANMIDRYYTAAFNALRWFGEWYGQYPYDYLTVVDPANDSRSGGMEYPTLFTGGTNMFAPKEASSPEGVTVHEFGHQFWYGLVGNNEFEEAWLDEGFNTYSTDRVIRTAWPQFKPVRYYFGGSGAGAYVGIPYVFDEVNTLGLPGATAELRRSGKNDVMARRGWEYNGTYGLNSYGKPGISLVMLERYLGEETMYRVMRTYHHRYRFQHPTSADFISAVNEISGKNMNWFFENTWYSSNLFDYAIDNIVNRRIPPYLGVSDGTPGQSASGVHYECEVTVKRNEDAIAPVDVLIRFADGTERKELWDGQNRWKKFTYSTSSPITEAAVDPDQKLVMDINWNNNREVVRDSDFRSVAARKYASKYIFWLQNFLEMTTYWN
ncbi:MAG: M1 family metallopeptidase [Bacteroidota bacterium]